MSKVQPKTHLTARPTFHEEWTRLLYDPSLVLSKAFALLPDEPAYLKLKLLLEAKEWEQLANWGVDPHDFNDIASFRSALSASSMLKKYEGAIKLNREIDTKAVALEKWEAAEKANLLTNDILRKRASGDFCFPRDVDRVLYAASRKIAQILSFVDLEDGPELSAFGPGVDLGVKKNSSPFNKMNTPGHATLDCVKYMVKNHVFDWQVFEMMKTGHALPPLEVVDYNRVTFVPKNTKTDRPIAVEPRWNIFFQKGLGRLIRIALKKAGCDLDDQTRNQRLASDLALATIDLSSASDTLSYGLVLDLFPIDWVLALDSLRSPMSLLPDKTKHLNQKFSSMGNGFTFELESLIFYALACAVKELQNSVGEVSVFGDDIIIGVDCYDLMTKVLTCVGFSVNTEKSYASSYYRESCGKHYFKGLDVTPIFVKKEPNNAERIVGLANQITVLAGRPYRGVYRDRDFFDCHRRLVRFVPKNLRFYGPTTINSCLHGPVDEHVLPRHPFWDAWVALVPSFVPVKHQTNKLPLLYEKLLQPTSFGNAFSTRKSGIWKIKKVAVRDNMDVGSWV